MLSRLADALANRYAVERELGRGGMATVWLARDVRVQRRVAIKVLEPALAGAIGADRFTREVQLTARLQHPGIVPVLDTGVIPASEGDPPLPWYAMPFIEGESLRTRLARDGQLTIDDALRITADVAGALQTAHEQGIVHRDIKPENVLLQGDRVYVVDFGIAKALVETGGERLTSTGIAIGTPAYMSPEQASAGPVDARSDQYGLATMLYEMLIGEPPFTGPTAQAVVARRFAEPARPIRTVRSAVPESVERAVLKALERAPADRFPDVASFASALRRGSAPVLRASLASRRLVIAGLISAVLASVALAAVRMRTTSSRAIAAPARDSTVVGLYRRGVRGYENRRPAGTLEAIVAFSEALRRDSTYAEAWAGLAKAYVRSYERAFTVPGVSQDSMLRLAVVAVERAQALGASNADTWLTQAMVSRNIDPTDRTATLRAARRAIALDSTNAAAWHVLAMALMETNDVEEALRAWQRSVAVDPTYTQALGFLGIAHLWRREYDSAIVWTDSAIAVDPNYLLGWSYVGQIETERGNLARAAAGYAAAARLATDVERVSNVAGSALVEARAGRRDHARAMLRALDSLAAHYQPPPTHLAVFLAQAYAALGDADGTMRWLSSKSPSSDLHFQLHLRCDPTFDPVATDPRFRALLLRARPPASQGCR
jgi:tRNA A-37 threonylcarbamoyl transferase component Bud32/tetratricopeptide (TPR) repeat protein